MRTQIIQLLKQIIDRRSIERRTPLVNVADLRRRPPPIKNHHLRHPAEELAEACRYIHERG